MNNINEITTEDELDYTYRQLAKSSYRDLEEEFNKFWGVTVISADIYSYSCTINRKILESNNWSLDEYDRYLIENKVIAFYQTYENQYFKLYE